MTKDKLKKKQKKNKSIQLTHLTCDLKYKARIAQQKGKQNNSRSLRPNNLISNDKNEIKVNFLKRP
jgi:hypothetical protein